MKLSEKTLLRCDHSKIHMTCYSLLTSFRGPMIRCKPLFEIHEAWPSANRTSQALKYVPLQPHWTTCRTLIPLAHAFPHLFPLPGLSFSLSCSLPGKVPPDQGGPFPLGSKLQSSPLCQPSPHCSVTLSTWLWTPGGQELSLLSLLSNTVLHT